MTKTNRQNKGVQMSPKNLLKKTSDIFQNRVKAVISSARWLFCSYKAVCENIINFSLRWNVDLIQNWIRMLISWRPTLSNMVLLYSLWLFI